jgi:hypothetical protein
VDGPFGNEALVGDNDYMYHRVRAFGDPGRYGDVTIYTAGSSIVFDGKAWVVGDDGEERACYSPADVRISLLWRGVAFADSDAARVFDEHLDDLDTATMVDVFLGDIADRGVKCRRPSDPLHDPSWIEVLNDTYGMGSFDIGDAATSLPSTSED